MSEQPAPLELPESKTLIVVDDVGIVRRAAARMLSDAGYRVFEAASAVEALEVLNTARRAVDLVITDVVMPDISGVALVRMIEAEWPATRILFMSAHAAEVLVQEGLAQPGVHFLAKPFTREELVAKVGDVLSAPPKGHAPGSHPAPHAEPGAPHPP
jgi:CheY-like chemotaxis protein